MTPPTLPPPHLIQEKDELRAATRLMRSSPRLAVDTESNSLYAYQEQVCLIQISSSEEDYLVDTLVPLDLSSLRTILSNPKIEKVLHGAEYDVICLKRDFGFHLVSLFDTRVALRTLGYKKTGLGDVLHREFGVRVNKRMQRANWGQRPLPDKLLNYARLDTHYLIELRDRLAQELKEKGRWEEAREECERISHLEQTNEEDPDKFWKITNARRLNPVQAAVLRELYYFREEQAEGLDRPTFKVIGDKTLLAIAQKMPRTPEALGRLHGMSAGQVQRFGKGLLEAVARGKNSPPPEPPQAEKVDDNVHNRYKKLRNWRKKKAQARQVESDIILPRDLVWEIARQPPRNLETLQELMQPLEWRFQRYGEEILQLIQK